MIEEILFRLAMWSMGQGIFFKMRIADGEFVGKVYLEKSLGIYLNNIQYHFLLMGLLFDKMKLFNKITYGPTQTYSPI